METKIINEIVFNGVETQPMYIDKKVIVAIVIPNDPSFNNVTFTIEASTEGLIDYVPLFDMFGNRLELNIGANRFIKLDVQDFTAVTYFKIRSTTDLSGKKIKIVLYNI